jgi:hypothetical protein
MLESPAWRALSLSAHRVFDRICIELAHHGGNDNGKLPVTYEHFVEYGIDRHAVAPAIRELEALGFVEVTQRGRPSAGEFRLPNLFRLTCVNCKSTPNPTHEWRRIPDTATAEARARVARLGRKQKSSVGNPHCTDGGNPHCEAKSPVGEIPTTVPGVETPTTSISRVEVPTFDPRSYSGPEGEISRRHKCNHCRQRGETRKVWHGPFAAVWLHPQCESDWKADYAERTSGLSDEREVAA